MDLLGLDRSRCRLGTTEHPFTLDLSKYDVRITTHYYENAFASSMFSVVHEGGHALYELHTADEYAYTGLGGGVSMAVHESQSRFFENIIARSRPFCEHIWPTLVELCPELGKYSAKDFYRAVNTSKPSLIRIEADELTYSLHIMVRYELERAFMHGELEARDLPSAWKELYRKYLGVEVPDDRSGVLQDSHWSGGQIGYFPSYALGSAYGAQIVAKMKETVDVDECVAAGTSRRSVPGLRSASGGMANSISPQSSSRTRWERRLTRSSTRTTSRPRWPRCIASDGGEDKRIESALRPRAPRGPGTRAQGRPGGAEGTGGGRAL